MALFPIVYRLVDLGAFRENMRRLPAEGTVVTVGLDLQGRSALAATAVCAVPAEQLVRVDRSGQMGGRIRKWGDFCVNVRPSVNPSSRNGSSAYGAPRTGSASRMHNGASLRPGRRGWHGVSRTSYRRLRQEVESGTHSVSIGGIAAFSMTRGPPPLWRSSTDIVFR